MMGIFLDQTKVVDQTRPLDQKELSEGILIIPGIESAISVPVIEADRLTEAQFREFWASQNKPCLIRGALRHWAAMEKWPDKDFWISNFDNIKVKVARSRNFGKPRNGDLEEIPFHDAIERLYSKRDEIFRIAAQVIEKDSPMDSLKNDLSGFPFLPSPAKPLLYPRMRLFMHRRATTNWHYHPVDESLMCQVKGAKRVLLLPPDMPRVEYVSGFLGEDLYLTGQVLDGLPDLKPQTIEVSEGDALYIPPTWYHGVYPTSDEIGFTLVYCWKSPLYKLGDRSNYFIRLLFKKYPHAFKKHFLFVKCLSIYARFKYFIRKTIR